MLSDLPDDDIGGRKASVRKKLIDLYGEFKMKLEMSKIIFRITAFVVFILLYIVFVRALINVG